MDDRERFYAKVNYYGPQMDHMDSNCWVWTAGRDKDGYGAFSIKGRKVRAHRFAYLLDVGELNDFHIDHLCRNKACVRWSHLEAVTNRENSARRAQSQTHCKNGHEFTEENTARYTYTVRDSRSGNRYSTVYRSCRACTKDRNAARTSRKKVA